MTYDSRPATREHISAVQNLLQVCRRELKRRLKEHDASKLVSPEVEAFDQLTPNLAKYEYGSPEYRAALQAPGIKHHQQVNDHHPEFFGHASYRGMDMFQLMEMCCDWIAASRRNPNGDVLASLEMNQERWGYDDDFKELLRRTINKILGLEKAE